MIESYAAAWNAKSADNEKAKKMISEFPAIQRDEINQMQPYVPKLSKALPAVKVARYSRYIPCHAYSN